MDDQQSYENSKKISELIKEINNWIKKVETEYNISNNQQSYNSYAETSDLIEKIDEWLKNIERLKNNVNGIGHSLDDFARNLEDAFPRIFNFNMGDFYMGERSIVMYMDCKKISNGSILCEHNITTYFYNIQNNNIRIACYSKAPSYEIICDLHNKALHDDNNYRPKTYVLFALPDSPQNRSFIEGIKKNSLDIFDMSFPEVFKNLGNQHVCISSNFSMDPNKSIEKNPEIITEDKFNYVTYNDGRHHMKMHGYTYTPPHQKCWGLLLDFIVYDKFSHIM